MILIEKNDLIPGLIIKSDEDGAYLGSKINNKEVARVDTVLQLLKRVDFGRIKTDSLRERFKGRRYSKKLKHKVDIRLDGSFSF